MQIKGEQVVLEPITEKDKQGFFYIATKSDGAKLWYDNKRREKRTAKAFFADWHAGYFNIRKPFLGQCFWICVGNEQVGVVAYNTIDACNKKTEVDIIIGDKKYMGKGYGPDALHTLCSYIFSHLDVNKIWIEARANNLRAIAAYKKAGFKQEGILKEENFFAGKFVDCVRLGMLRKNFT